LLPLGLFRERQPVSSATFAGGPLKACPGIFLLKPIQQFAQVRRRGRSIPIKGETKPFANLMADGAAMHEIHSRVIRTRLHHGRHRFLVPSRFVNAQGSIPIREDNRESIET